MAGFRDRLADLIRSKQPEYVEYDEESNVPAPIGTRHRQASQARLLERFGFPSQMDRSDWELAFRAFGQEFLVRGPTSEEEDRFLDLFNLVDKVIERAIRTDGVIYFPTQRLQHDTLCNLLLHKNTGNTHGVVADLTLCLISFAMLYGVSDEYKIEIMQMWDHIQSGELSAANGTYIDKGPMTPAELVLTRPVKIGYSREAASDPKVVQHHIKTESKENKSAPKSEEKSYTADVDGIDWVV